MVGQPPVDELTGTQFEAIDRLVSARVRGLGILSFDQHHTRFCREPLYFDLSHSAPCSHCPPARR